MTTQIQLEDEPTAESPPDSPRSRWRDALGPSRIGAVYFLVLCVIVFSLWKPNIFPDYLTVASILNSAAIPGMLALALIVPLSAGVFDLSVGFTLGASAIVVAKLLESGASLWWACAVAIVVCACVGLVNAVGVVVLKVDSFIATLATGSLLQALILFVSGNQQITTNVIIIQDVVQSSLRNITVPVFAFFATAVILWLILDKTVTGRHIYATGLGKEQARLSGIPTARIQFFSFFASAGIAGVAGILLLGIVGAGSPDMGSPYLIPAFAAAFLGSTQLKDGLFNAWGTVLAVLLLGTINEGLALATDAIWAPYVFNGVVLLAALALRSVQTSRLSLRRLMGVIRQGRPEAAA